jgi:hypothetical protein
MSQLALTEFRETLRFLLGDRDPSEPMFTDLALDGALRSTVRLNAVPALTLVPGVSAVTPLPTANQFALLCYHTAQRWFESEPAEYSYKTRALSEKFGDWQGTVTALEDHIHELENGTMFGGYQDLRSFLAGFSGIAPVFRFAEMTGAKPVVLVPYPQVSVQI